MGYRLKPGEPLEQEARRIADKQLRLAIADLRAASGHGAEKAIHSARRHVKKVRAITRLVRGSLGSSYGITIRELRNVGRMLASVSDGEAAVDTLVRLQRAYKEELPAETYSAIRANLLRRKRRGMQKARSERVLQNAVHQLRAEETAIQAWRLTASGFRAIAPGLKRTYRGARRAMRLALAHPTMDSYHSWRQRVKDHWFQVRLLERRSGGQLATVQRQLEALDGKLGEYHNCVVLQHAVLTDTLDSRRETARVLRLLRRYQRDLRRAAQEIGVELYREKPRPSIRRIHQLWRAADAGRATKARPSWPAVA